MFGPKPKFDQHVAINKKEKRAAIRYLLAEKIKANQVCVLDSGKMKKPATKVVARFLESQEMLDHRVLFLGEGDSLNQFLLSMRNIPKKEFSRLASINGYNLTLCRDIVILDVALEQFLSVLG